MSKSLFCFYNPNPSKATKVNDCVVRALSLATDTDWLETYDHLNQLGRLLYRMPNEQDTYSTFLMSSGFRRVTISAPQKGSKRITVHQFAAAHPTGSYVLRLSHHLVTVKNGLYHDTWDCGDKAVYTYWEKIA